MREGLRRFQQFGCVVKKGLAGLTQEVNRQQIGRRLTDARVDRALRRRFVKSYRTVHDKFLSSLRVRKKTDAGKHTH